MTLPAAEGSLLQELLCPSLVGDLGVRVDAIVLGPQSMHLFSLLSAASFELTIGSLKKLCFALSKTFIQNLPKKLKATTSCIGRYGMLLNDIPGFSLCAEVHQHG
jgi:hypothetical protein